MPRSYNFVAWNDYDSAFQSQIRQRKKDPPAHTGGALKHDIPIAFPKLGEGPSVPVRAHGARVSGFC